jgi:hypothetical protein
MWISARGNNLDYEQEVTVKSNETASENGCKKAKFHAKWEEIKAEIGHEE